ncbi:MAG TPA: hypothetical protein VKE74_16345, partial [Gemmataceae bacterium]|nr:hypothetical protein [Gemmataceae bacterium]
MRLLVLVLLPILAGPAIAQPPGCPCPNVVLRWNEAALGAIQKERTPPPVAARNLAIVHVAVYDAVNAVDGTHRPFLVGFERPVDADPSAAAAIAAHRTLADLYPARLSEFDAVLDETLGDIPEGRAKARGILLGQMVAERVLRWRASDGQVARASDYRPRLEPGRWRPTPPRYQPPLLPG